MEFVTLTVLLLVPLVYLVTTALRVQQASFAVTTAAREAGRAFATADNPGLARTRATAAARLALADHGLVLPPGALVVTCRGGGCLEPGTEVAVDVRLTVALPLIPQVFEGSATSIPVAAWHVAPVDRYRGST